MFIAVIPSGFVYCPIHVPGANLLISLKSVMILWSVLVPVFIYRFWGSIPPLSQGSSLVTRMLSMRHAFGRYYVKQSKYCSLTKTSIKKQL